jgi:hypothetical protein
MHLQFQGAARTVTGSMHVLTVGPSTILLDCGMYHGKRDESRGRNCRFEDAGQAEKLGEGLQESGFLHVGIPAPGDEAPLV